MSDIILALSKATKLYAGVPAIEGVDFELRRGEIHALVGENGAGKSTLTKVMAGVVTLTSGTMQINGVEVAPKTPLEARNLGIAMVFQENSLVPTMTVAQNLFLGQEQFYNRLRGIYIAAQQFLQSLNFDVTPTATVGLLGAAKKQMVEIARAVLHEAKVIIFDEPTATLTPEEKKYFFDLVRDLKRRGVSIVFISHALEEALILADRITVLRDGKHVITDDANKFDRARIVQAMVGRDLSNTLYGKRKTTMRAAGARVLTVQNLKMAPMVQEQFAVGVRRPDHRRVRAGRRRPHRDVQDRRRRHEAGLLSRRRDHPARQAGALPRACAGGAGRHRLCHGGPQGRGFLRDHVGRPQHLSRPAGEAARRAVLPVAARGRQDRRRPGSRSSRSAPPATT